MVGLVKAAMQVWGPEEGGSAEPKQGPIAQQRDTTES